MLIEVERPIFSLAIHVMGWSLNYVTGVKAENNKQVVGVHLFLSVFDCGSDMTNCLNPCLNFPAIMDCSLEC